MIQRSVYEDSDGVRKEEIAALGGGQNVFSAFYDRLKVRLDLTTPIIFSRFFIRSLLGWELRKGG